MYRICVCAYALSVFVVLSKRVYHFTMEVCDTDSYNVQWPVAIDIAVVSKIKGLLQQYICKV